MIIANPIYDTVFKRLMENKRIARFFIETIIEEKVEDIAIVPQEYTYLAKVKNKKEENKAENVDTKEEWEVLSLIRFDFVATIRNPDGENKKVLIEIQKSNKPSPTMILIVHKPFAINYFQCLPNSATQQKNSIIWTPTATTNTKIGKKM